MKVAFWTIYESWLKNQMFDLSSEANQNDVLVRYVALKQFLADKGIEFNTYDVYPNFKEVDVWLMMDPHYATFKFILKNFINPRKIALFLNEPLSSNLKAWRFLWFYTWLFKAMITWHTKLSERHKKFLHFFSPTTFDKNKHPYYKQQKKKNLCLMMHSNKNPNVKVRGQLISLRREVISYFDRRGDALLDLYGPGWNDKGSPWPFFTDLYKGMTDDKRETFSQCYFAFCIDNHYAPGYIEYDPFISMATATVPIYYPMPDSLNYIPENTFINYNDFNSMDELVLYLQSIAGTPEYEEYRKKGWEFINSEKFRPFTVEQFCEDIYKVIQYVAS